MVGTAVLAIAAGCSRQSPSGRSRVDRVPDEIIRGFVTEESDSGRAQWKLSAPQAQRFSTSQALEMVKPRIQFFDNAGVVKTVLVADSGLYHDDTRDLLAIGNVVVKASRGDVLETDTLRYLNARDMIVTDSFVKLTRGSDVLTGYGLECDRDLNEVVIKRSTKARIMGDADHADASDSSGVVR